MNISELKSSFLSQMISHLGADVEVPPLKTYDMSQVTDPTMLYIHDELTKSNNNSSLISLREQFKEAGAIVVENPENLYDEEYGDGRFHSQYGDGGYCADFIIYGLDRVYNSIGITPDLSMELGLGYGTAQLHHHAKTIEATIPIDDPSSFNAGNIVTLSHTMDVSENENYNGHTIVVLSSEESDRHQGVVKIRALEGNAYNEELGDNGIVVSNYLYDTNTREIFPATENWRIHPEIREMVIEGDYGLSVTSVIDPDLLPNASEVSQKLGQTTFKPELPDAGYVRESFHDHMKNKALAALKGEDYDGLESSIGVTSTSQVSVSVGIDLN